MKICWETLEKITFINNGIFRVGESRNNYTYYKEEDSCAGCGEPYLTSTKKHNSYCSNSCSLKKEVPFKGKTHSEKRKKIIGNQSRLRNQGNNHPSWKGGITKTKEVLYNTFSSQIDFCEENRRDPNNLELLQVKCTKCKEWFSPNRTQIKNRINALSDSTGRENRFYCSDECKHSCSIFNKVKYSSEEKRSKTNSNFTSIELNTWSQEVLKRANYVCEYCEKFAEHAHHIQPKKLEPFLALDPDNGVACCEECHYKYGHKDECSTLNIANIICID